MEQMSLPAWELSHFIYFSSLTLFASLFRVIPPLPLIAFFTTIMTSYLLLLYLLLLLQLASFPPSLPRGVSFDTTLSYCPFAFCFFFFFSSLSLRGTFSLSYPVLCLSFGIRELNPSFIKGEEAHAALTGHVIVLVPVILSQLQIRSYNSYADRLWYTISICPKASHPFLVTSETHLSAEFVQIHTVTSKMHYEGF